MKKKVLGVLLDKFADWESAYISTGLASFGAEQYEFKTVALSTECVTSIGGLRVLPDYSVPQAPDDFAAVFLIGGMSWRTKEARRVEPLVRFAAEKGRLLGGICDAAGFLGTCGVLNAVKHTANDLDDMKAWAGQAYTGEKCFVHRQAVIDGNVVTANGTAPLEFASKALCALCPAKEDMVRQWYDFHKLGMYGALMPAMGK